jgi:hypothetical protein
MRRIFALSLYAVVLWASVGNKVHADELELDLKFIDHNWWLYAEVIPTVGGVDGSNGISEVRALINNIDFGTDGDAVTFASGIGATDPVMTSEGLRAPVLQTTGGTLDILYSQDTSDGLSVVGGIGTSDRTLIASGTFASDLTFPTWGDDDLGATSHGLFLDTAAPGPFGDALEPDETNLEESAVLLGDVNRDGVFDSLDIKPFVNLIAGGGYQPEGDLAPRGNPDGIVDALDIYPFIVIENIETPLTAALNTVPEPSSLAIALFGLLGIGGRRRWEGGKPNG